MTSTIKEHLIAAPKLGTFKYSMKSGTGYGVSMSGLIRSPEHAGVISCALDGQLVDNAALLRSAEDLLEALHQAKEWLEGWGSAERQLAFIDAALAKAEGRQP